VGAVSPKIAMDSLIEAQGCHTVEARQIEIQHHPGVPQGINRLGNQSGDNDFSTLRSSHSMSIPPLLLISQSVISKRHGWQFPERSGQMRIGMMM
jgi:hypothetical protein